MTVSTFLHVAGPSHDHHEDLVWPWKGETWNSSVSTEKCLMAAIKVYL